MTKGDMRIAMFALLFTGAGSLVLVIINLTSPQSEPPTPTSVRQPRQTEERQPRPAQKPPAQAEPKTAMVRIMVDDGTDLNPLPERSNLWFRGVGSWWIKRHVRRGGVGGGDFARVPVGTEDHFAIYPDGEDGVEINVPFKMTAKMNPDGSARDTIHVTITDHSVTVLGLPIKAATGEIELSFDR